MYIGYTEEQERLRQELRAYYAELLTPEVEAELADSKGVGETMRRVVRQMGADGWLGVGWPEEWGGRGFTAIEQFVWFDESMRAGAPVPMLTINSVGPTIRQFGSKEQQDFFIPGILKGEIHFCIGYTEPSAGTDLANLKTTAIRDGDEYVVNGQKIFTSLAGGADYIWLAARTDPEAKKHKGISMFCVPMDTPGLSIQPMSLLSEHDINQTFFDDMRIPASCLVGKENEGWGLITNQLNHERVTLCSSGVIDRHLVDVQRWAQETKLADGRRVIDQEWVQVNLARLRARLEYLRLMNWKVAWTATQGHLDAADASSIKVFGTEFYLEAYRVLMEIIGERAYLKDGSPDAVLHARLERVYRSTLILTFGGGTNEIQRDLIAMFGLGFPRASR
ncbi:MAG: acyl-CoA dehydrogenase family protein [Acidobacteriota bacterium]|nr:acyl-CoA dehydrogenase family protein [Acidobacteriota bacterium]